MHSGARQDVGGEFVVSCGDTAEVLETAEGVLDQVAATVPVLVVADGAFAVASTGDDRNGSSVAKRAAQQVGIIALVGEQVSHAGCSLEQGRCGLHVTDVASRQHQRIGTPITSVSAWILVVQPPRERPIAWVDLPRSNGEAFAQRGAVCSNCAGLV